MTSTASMPPIADPRLAISFANEIAVASIALEAYLIISAVAALVCTIGTPSNPAYSSRSAAMVRLSPPMTIRSGRMKSSTACPSVRNSGLTPIPKSIPARFPEARSHAGRTTWSDVPGTTVLFTTTAWNPAVAASAAPICSAACCTKDTSMLPSGREGVPTQMKVSSLPATAAARSVVALQPAPQVAPEQRLEPALEDGRLAAVERGHLALVDVDARDGVPQLGQPDRGHQADVARADHRNPRHRSSPPWFPVYHRSARRSPSASVDPRLVLQFLPRLGDVRAAPVRVVHQVVPFGALSPDHLDLVVEEVIGEPGDRLGELEPSRSPGRRRRRCRPRPDDPAAGRGSSR